MVSRLLIIIVFLLCLSVLFTFWIDTETKRDIYFDFATRNIKSPHAMSFHSNASSKASTRNIKSPHAMSFHSNASSKASTRNIKSPNAMSFHSNASPKAKASPVSEEFTTTFTFPSPGERITYYMGGWANRILSTQDIPCREIFARGTSDSDQPVLWTKQTLQRIIARQPNDWRVDSYMKDSLNIVENAAKSDQMRIIVILGDSHSKSTKLPAIAKTRFSRFASPKHTNEPFFSTIIWPLEMQRHYTGVDEYTKLRVGNTVPRWEEKKSSLIWRGGVTGILGDHDLLKGHVDGGQRIQVVRKYFHGNISDVDVAFSSVQWVPHSFQVEQLQRKSVTMTEQLTYKYLLVIEGNDVATGLKWMLASNSVVFMARPMIVSFLMEDLLVPFVHYVPLKDDSSDLVDMVQWARRNDNKCKWITQQANAYMNRLWIGERAKREHAEIKKSLGEVYHGQFGEAIRLCA